MRGPSGRSCSGGPPFLTGSSADYSAAVSDRVADYHFDHPPEAVAQVPLADREQSRLLCVRRFALEAGSARAPVSPVMAEGVVADLPRWLAPGDLLVVNDVAVLPARLVAWRHTGGRVSVLVLSAQGRRATVLLGTRGTLQPGEILELDGDRWALCASLGQGRFEIEVAEGRDVERLMAEVGRMPLPPYIERDPVRDARDDLDRERYRTTFASTEGRAVAAPTAGLHLTPELLARCEAAGARVARVRLHVGEGTFRPLRGETLDEHVMHEEQYEVPEPAAQAFADTRARGGRVVAVGTTVVRVLESAVADHGRRLAPGPGSTALFIRPGHRFAAVDALLTNFHQPCSTLLVLVSAFAGLASVRAAYAHAIAAGYRLFSYGDAMLLADPLPPPGSPSP